MAGNRSFAIPASMLPAICSTCRRKPHNHCWGGELEYADGSGMACPNWVARLDEIAGLDSDEEERVRAQFR